MINRFFCIDVTYPVSLSYHRSLSYYRARRTRRKSAVRTRPSFAPYQINDFAAHSRPRFCACAVAKFEVDDDECDHTSKFVTKGTFPNVLITYLTFQRSSNTRDKSCKMLGIIFFLLTTEPPIRRRDGFHNVNRKDSQYRQLLTRSILLFTQKNSNKRCECV